MWAVLPRRPAYSSGVLATRNPFFLAAVLAPISLLAVSGCAQSSSAKLCSAIRRGFSCPNVVIADAYVPGCNGAAYVDGTPMPYSPRVLAAMMRDDPKLSVFIRQQAKRLSPAWPQSAIS
jgi:hypothetical protein